jgi:hypothetical protein
VLHKDKVWDKRCPLPWKQAINRREQSKRRTAARGRIWRSPLGWLFREVSGYFQAWVAVMALSRDIPFFSASLESRNGLLQADGRQRGERHKAEVRRWNNRSTVRLSRTHRTTYQLPDFAGWALSLGLGRFARLIHRTKILILLLLLSVVPASDALAGVSRDEDWTVEIAGGQYGLAGDSLVTHICYGRGFFDVHLPFFGTVALAAFLPIVCVGIFYVIRRRKSTTD